MVGGLVVFYSLVFCFLFFSCHLWISGGTSIWWHAVWETTSKCSLSGPESWASSPSAPTVSPRKPQFPYCSVVSRFWTFSSVVPSAREVLPSFFLPRSYLPKRKSGSAPPPRRRHESPTFLFSPCCVMLASFRFALVIPVFF